jgi:hypothetical protein
MGGPKFLGPRLVTHVAHVRRQAYVSPGYHRHPYDHALHIVCMDLVAVISSPSQRQGRPELKSSSVLLSSFLILNCLLD